MDDVLGQDTGVPVQRVVDDRDRDGRYGCGGLPMLIAGRRLEVVVRCHLLLSLPVVTSSDA
jgi:hypothetical protein